MDTRHHSGIRSLDKKKYDSSENMKLQELKTALREEWDCIPKGVLDSSVKQIENRCKMCIRLRGQRTSY
ncbi:hypothetical protein TNCV_953911 [Trichonephila clavipes]|nr:hypothetical protein TNCV_953911 [Trichonephila clavipes]